VSTEIKIDKILDLKVSKALSKTVQRSKMNGYMKLIADQIKIRTRLGYHAKKLGEKKRPIQKLKASTIATRKKIKEAGLLSGLTRPNKSNLTATGQMLDALIGRGTGNGSGIIEVDDSSRWDSNESNSDVAGYAEDGGRPFLNLTDKEVKELIQEITKVLTKELRRM